MLFNNLNVCHFNIVVDFIQISVSLFGFNSLKIETLTFVCCHILELKHTAIAP